MSTASRLIAALAFGVSVIAITAPVSAQPSASDSWAVQPTPNTAEGQPAGTVTNIPSEDNLVTGQPPEINEHGQTVQSNTLKSDRPTYVNGVKTACAGVTLDDRADPQWKEYGAKIETVGGYGQFLGHMQLTVTRLNGNRVAEFGFNGPWALMKLDPGRYAVTIDVANLPEKHIALDVPKNGQKDVIVRYPKQLAGEEQMNRMAENPGEPNQ